MDRKILAVLAVLICVFFLPTNPMARTLSAADSVQENFIINAANLEPAKSMHFAGRPIVEMLLDRVEWQIRNYGLVLTLKNPRDYPLDPRFIQLTEKYASQVRYDPNTKNISGYIGGIPFPKIDPADPDAAGKVIWNATYGWQQSNNFYSPTGTLLIDGNRGIDRIEHVQLERYYLISRVGEANPTSGDGSIFHKTLLVTTYPQDVKGVGTFSIRYTTGKLDDFWAYIRAVRRVRRLSGGAWVDPIQASDQLQDDIGVFNAHPTWYRTYRLVGEQIVLTPTNESLDTWNSKATSIEEQFPKVDLQHAPYWNPKENWEPRQVFVLEGVPPDYHPYSRKIMTIDTRNWVIYSGETFDRKGDFWKWMQYGFCPQPSLDGAKDGSGNPLQVYFQCWALFVDFQRLHATYRAFGADQAHNIPTLTEDDISLSRLEAMGR